MVFIFIVILSTFRVIHVLNKRLRSKFYVGSEFDIIHLKKTEGCIGRKVVSITMMMKTIVRIFKVKKTSIIFYQIAPREFSLKIKLVFFHWSLSGNNFSLNFLGDNHLEVAGSILTAGE